MNAPPRNFRGGAFIDYLERALSDGGVQGCVLGATVQRRRTGGAQARGRVRVLRGGKREVRNHLVVNIAAACATATAQGAERVDVALVLELHLTAENALAVRTDGPDVQACAAAAVASASAGCYRGEGELAVGAGEQCAGATLAAVGAGCVRAAGAFSPSTTESPSYM